MTPNLYIFKISVNILVYFENEWNSGGMELINIFDMDEDHLSPFGQLIEDNWYSMVRSNNIHFHYSN